MSTLAQTIIDAAVKSSLLNDDGRSAVASNTAEILAFLTRTVRHVYTVAAMPKDHGGAEAHDLLGVTETKTVNSGSPPSVSDAAFRYQIATADAEPVAVVTRRDLLAGRAELPPAVVIEQRAVRSAGRLGDPVNGDVLTVYYVPVPGELTIAGSHYIGATTPATASTSMWPDHAGNPWLIAKLREYLATKRGDADPAEIEQINAEVARTGQIFAAFLGINETFLVSSREPEDG